MGLVLVFIGAVLVASKIGFTMESPKTTSSTNAVISDYSGGPCWVASQNVEDQIGYTDCSQHHEQKVGDWPHHIITHYPDGPDKNSDGSLVLSQRLVWQAAPGKMCNFNYKTGSATSLEDCVKKCMAHRVKNPSQDCNEFSYQKTSPTGGECRMGNKKTDGVTGLRCEGIKNDEKCMKTPSDCVLYSMIHIG